MHLVTAIISSLAFKLYLYPAITPMGEQSIFERFIQDLQKFLVNTPCLQLDVEDCYIRHKKERLDSSFRKRNVEAEEKEFSKN